VLATFGSTLPDPHPPSRIRRLAAPNKAGLLYLRIQSRKAIGTGNRKTLPADVFVDGTVMVMLLVVEEDGLRTEGEKVQVAPAGSPVQLRLSCWLNPFCGVTVSIIWPEFPGSMDIDGCASVSEKSGCGVGVVAPTSMSVSGAETDGESAPSPLYEAMIS